MSDRYPGTGQVLTAVTAGGRNFSGFDGSVGGCTESVPETDEKAQSAIGGRALRTTTVDVRCVQRLPEIQARVQTQDLAATAVVGHVHVDERRSTGQRHVAETATGPDGYDGEADSRQDGSGGETTDDIDEGRDQVGNGADG